MTSVPAQLAAALDLLSDFAGFYEKPSKFGFWYSF
jgi:hypothetical protein